MTVPALVLEAPWTLRRRELPCPQIGEDDGLLRVEACGLCGTDHEQFSGHLFGGFAFIPGHESVGVIEEIGPAAAARWGVAAGDRVAVEVFQSCRACTSCDAGDYRHCRNHGIGDSYGFVPADRSPGLWGGYARYQYLSPDSMLLKVPDALDPVTATLFNPMGAGVRWAATLPGTKPGDVVAILGPGIRGICSLVAARAAGAGFIMVTGAGRVTGPAGDRPRVRRRPGCRRHRGGPGPRWPSLCHPTWRGRRRGRHREVARGLRPGAQHRPRRRHGRHRRHPGRPDAGRVQPGPGGL